MESQANDQRTSELTSGNTFEENEISVLTSRPYRRFKVIVISVILTGVILLVVAITTPLVVGTRGIPESSQVVFSWSEWSSWEPHNTTCGYKMRIRKCRSLYSKHYRASCTGPMLQKRRLALCRDCKEWYLSGNMKTDGEYTIRPDSLDPFKVYCDMTTDGGGWTVFQRRQDGSEDFYRTWDEYKTGFGNLTGEFWLGNDKIHRLTANETSLRVDLADWNGNSKHAKYRKFNVMSSLSNYRLSVDGFSGTTDDSLTRAHNGMEFSTKDNDNDVFSSGNCAVRMRGAWWYNNCYDSNLNGLYVNNSINVKAVTWYGFNGSLLALKFTEMKLRST